MEDKLLFVVIVIVNAGLCLFNCYGIIRNHLYHGKKYLKGFDDGCKFMINEVKKMRDEAL